MQNWDELEDSCKNCSRCSLCHSRTNLVFGSGDRKARLMFVGEGPGETEDKLGEPFVGRAGKMLDAMLASVGISRKDIYIANIVKCRPPQNRDPLPDERDACFPWLDNQIRLISPEIIVCLGRIAAMRFIKPDFKISQEHGLWFEYYGIKTTAIYHPAALLRDPSRRGDTFEDMRRIEEELK
jgi:DNA polymerase